MNRILFYIYIPFTLGLDLYSTYWASKGDINNIIELHFLSSVFGQGFKGLSIIFLIECIILLLLTRLSDYNIYNYKKEYKILKINKRKNTIDLNKIIKSMPIVVFIICTSHIIFSLNNFLLGLYLRGIDSNIANFYIKKVHIEQRVYLIHITIIIITTIIILLFMKKDKRTKTIS